MKILLQQRQSMINVASIDSITAVKVVLQSLELLVKTCTRTHVFSKHLREIERKVAARPPTERAAKRVLTIANDTSTTTTTAY